MSDIIKKYNPANAASLSPEDLQGLQDLTSGEIKELAQAYPNATMQRPYLLIIEKDKPSDKQLPRLSTYENLWNLREKNGLKNYVAFGFKGNYVAKPIPANKRTEVVDLSETELISLPGFKQNGVQTEPQKVAVTKVKRKLASDKKTKSK